MSRRILLSALLLLLSFCLNAQLPSYVRYGPEHGLNSSTVYCAFQDSKGYMWFGTDAGVARFNGKQFESFTTADGLSDNEVLRIFEDRSNRIWFLLFNGRLSYYKAGKFFNEHNDVMLEKTFSGEHFDSFFEDSRGRIFFGTGHGYYVVLDGEKVERFRLNDFKSQELSFSEDISRMVIINTGFYQYAHTDQGPSNLFTVNSVSGHTRNMLSYRKNGLYLNDNGLFVHGRKGTESQMPAGYFPEFKKNLIGVREDLNGDIWVMRWSMGAVHYTREQGGWKLVRSHLSALSIHSVYPDREGNYWFCTNDEGVYLLRGNTTSTLNIDHSMGLATNNIYVLGTDGNGNIWAGGKDLWVSCINGDSIKNIQLLPNTTYGKVRDFYFDSKERIWFLADQGLFLLHNNRPVLIPAFGYNITTYNYSAKFIHGSRSGAINVTCSKRMLQLKESKNPDSLKLVEFIYDSLSFPRTYCHHNDLSGRLWISNLNGLHYYEHDSLIRHKSADPGIHSRIIAIAEAGDSTLILCTEGHGVIFFRNDSVINRLNTKNGLPSSLCRNVSITGKNLLVSTNAGLLSAEYKNNELHHLKVYTTADGLPNNDIRTAIMTNDRIYIATSAGITIVKPARDSHYSNPPVLYITSIVQGGSELNIDSALQFPYNKNSLGIHYHAITYQRPEKIQYQYKINSGWINTNNDYIEVASLVPGKYTFSVRAKKYDSEWCQPVSYSFLIEPPFWGRAWFKAVVVILFIAVAVQAGVLINRRKLRLARQELEKVNAVNLERTRISSDLHDDIGSGLTEISILSKVGKGIRQSEDSKKIFSQISVSSATLLDNISEIIWTLNNSNDLAGNLVAYIREYTSSFCEKHNIECQINIPDNISDTRVSAITRRNLFLIVKEALTNSLKHADCKSIGLSIQLVNGNMILSIKDDGKGFEIDSGGMRKSGLVNMKRRMNEIGGRLVMTSSDKEGTMVVIELPFNKVPVI